jgi:hypothetical protein
LTTPAILSTEALFFLVKGALKAVCDRPGLTPEEKQSLLNQGWDVIMDYGPIDAQRAMLIGQSLVLNEMLAQAATDAIQSAVPPEASRAARANYASVYRAFHQNQTALARLQAKAEAAQKKPAKTEAQAETSDEAAPVDESPANAPHGPEAEPDHIPLAAQPAELSESVASGNIPAASAGQHHQHAGTGTVRAPEQPRAPDDFGEDIRHAPYHGSPSHQTRNNRADAPEFAEA